MNISGSRVLVLGGSGLVGTAVCRELVRRKPAALIIHGQRAERAEATAREIASLKGPPRVTAISGDIFGLRGEPSRRERIFAHLRQLRPGDLDRFSLYRLLVDSRADLVVDCVNTATGIAYRNLFHAAEQVAAGLDGGGETEDIEQLLESLYVPRLIRHVQVMYRGMTDAGTRAYMKVGTSGTGGMGFNIPYTHSEERPSRMLLSKSAVAGAHSMLLFLMARTPGAPVTKEIKPTAAIAWKKIEAGPIYRRGVPIRMVDAEPHPLGNTFSTRDPDAARERDDILTTAYIDTGENGIYSVEEFAALTTAEQMEFVTPEEIAQYLVFEVEGGNTGHDIVNALDNAVLGPSYRAGLMRHWALEQLNELERKAGTRSVAFEMLGPPHVTKLLFEAHLLREAFGTMTAVRDSAPDEVERRLVELVRQRPEVANEVAAVGIPLLLPGGEIIRGTSVIVPGDAENEPLIPEKLERWVEDGWVDLRRENCQRWITRFQLIHEQVTALPRGDTSSAHLRTTRFWDEESRIQPGKIVGWVLSEEEHGTRVKD